MSVFSTLGEGGSVGRQEFTPRSPLKRSLTGEESVEFRASVSREARGSTHARFRCGPEEDGIDGLDARASTVILVISEEISGSQGAVRDGGGGRPQSRWAPQTSTKDSDADDGPKELVRKRQIEWILKDV